MKEGDYDLAIGTRGLGNLDPTSLLREFFHSEGATNLASHFCYANPKIDAAFDALTHTYEIDDRKVLYHEIREELLLHPAVIPLLEDENLAVCSKKSQATMRRSMALRWTRWRGRSRKRHRRQVGAFLL